jgi:GMP synthase-like glutamine amidotransferase
MRITIIDADRPDPEVRHRWPSYGGMCATWLGAALPEAQFALVNVVEGEDFPDIAMFDAVLLTGSRAGAYEDHPWIAPYLAFLRQCRDAGRPVGGICFGHQIMAAAFGGTVEKSHRGWAIGRKRHAVTEAGRAHFPDHLELTALSFHQDQVVRLPPEARIILGNDHSPHGGIEYPFAALSVQFHPEFDPDYVSGLLDRMGPDLFSEALVQDSRAGLEQPIDNAAVAHAFARFYRRHCGAEARAG